MSVDPSLSIDHNSNLPKHHDEATKKKLNEILTLYYRRSIPPKPRHESLKQLHSFLTNAVHELLTYVEYNSPMDHKEVAILFGSVTQTTMTVGSDLDMAVNMPSFTKYPISKSEYVKRKERKHLATKALTHLAVILQRKYPIIYKTQKQLQIVKVFTATVPILRVVDPETKANGDISMAHFYTHFTVQFMNRFTGFGDDRIRPFIVFLKMFTKQRGVNCGRQGYFNSFGITLLAIKWLQLVSPPILPILRYSSDFSEIEEVKAAQNEENKLTISDLLCGFLDFYGNVFQPVEHHISLLHYEWKYKDKSQFDCRDGQLYLIVEDPVQISNNVSKNLRPDQWDHTKNVFRRGHRILMDYDLSTDLSTELRMALPSQDCKDVIKEAQEVLTDEESESLSESLSDYAVHKMDQNDENEDHNKSYLCGKCYLAKQDGCQDETDGIWYCLECWKVYNNHGDAPAPICVANGYDEAGKPIESSHEEPVITNGYEPNFIEVLSPPRHKIRKPLSAPVPATPDSPSTSASTESPSENESDQEVICELAKETPFKLMENDEYDSMSLSDILQDLFSCTCTCSADIERIAAYCLMYLGNDEEAEYCFQVAMEYSDHDVREIDYLSLFEYGCFLFERKRYKEAEEYFGKLLADLAKYERNKACAFVAHSVSKVHLYYARTLEGMNEANGNIEYECALQKVNQYDTDCDTAWIHYYYGLFCYKMKQFEKYEHHLRKCIELHPGLEEAMESLNRYYAREDCIETVNNRKAFDRFWWGEIDTKAATRKQEFNAYYDEFVKANMNDMRVIVIDQSIESKIRNEIGMRCEDDLRCVLKEVEEVRHRFKSLVDEMKGNHLMKYYAFFIYEAIYSLSVFNQNVSSESDIYEMMQRYNQEEGKGKYKRVDAGKLSVLIDTLQID